MVRSVSRGRSPAFSIAGCAVAMSFALSGCAALRMPAKPGEPVVVKDDAYEGPDPGRLPSSLLTGSNAPSAPDPGRHLPVRHGPLAGEAAMDPDVLSTLLNTMNGSTPQRTAAPRAGSPAAVTVPSGTAAPVVPAPKPAEEPLNMATAPRPSVGHETLAVPPGVKESPPGQVVLPAVKPIPKTEPVKAEPAAPPAPAKDQSSGDTVETGMSPVMAAKLRAARRQP